MKFLVFLSLCGVACILAQTPGYQDKFITLNGLRIHYLDWGANGKPPFIMLHGISRVAHQFARDMAGRLALGGGGS